MFLLVWAAEGRISRLVRLSMRQLDDVLKLGARWGVENNYGWERDIEFLEERGCLENADLSTISQKAKIRGAPQLGSLGAGNHFLEILNIYNNR